MPLRILVLPGDGIGPEISRATLQVLRSADAAFALGLQGGINPSAELRVAFDLYANIRPCRSREGLSCLRKPMDLAIVRENTEGFYSDRNMFAGSGEFMPRLRARRRLPHRPRASENGAAGICTTPISGI